MNREIKFRGLTDSGNWVYGSLINNMWTYSKLTDKESTPVCEIITGNYESDNWQDAIDEETNLVQVKTETVGQYTGLKDKNGKEIYEGDVIEHHVAGVGFEQGVIVFVLDRFKIDWLRISGGISTNNGLHYNHAVISVIGNIYENPDLMS